MLNHIVNKLEKSTLSNIRKILTACTKRTNLKMIIITVATLSNIQGAMARSMALAKICWSVSLMREENLRRIFIKNYNQRTKV